MSIVVPEDRSWVVTEGRHPRSDRLHMLSVEECVELITEVEREAFDAVKAAWPAIASFLEEAVVKFEDGGRLIYVGAGTSGRLGALDAAEMPATFQLDPARVVGVIAGGDVALRQSSEGVEDDEDAARHRMEDLQLHDTDIVLGISAGGTTPYVLEALRYTKECCPKALTGLLTSSTTTPVEEVDHLIVVDTGPEVLTGSTRMKAGTATKTVLNTISTTLMIRCGRVYDNLMVDLHVTNDKLRDRAIRIIAILTGLSRQKSLQLLTEADGAVKVALLMGLRGLSAEEARSALERCRGHFHEALGEDCRCGDRADAGDFEYIACVDGGATKTTLQILDREGQVVPLYKGEERLDEARGDASSIFEVGNSGIRKALFDLFDELYVGDRDTPLRCISGRTLLVAGMAGVRGGRRSGYVRRFLEGVGFRPHRIVIKNDVDLLAEGFDDPCVVLNAGTGSYCVGRVDNTTRVAGGLGRVFGDEGSGYFIGLEAFKASLACSGGWGKQTSLVQRLQEKLELDDLDVVVDGVNSGEWTKAMIADLASVVFEEAATGDGVAGDIVQKAGHHLAQLLAAVLGQLGKKKCPVYLTGGVFSDKHSQIVVDALVAAEAMQEVIARYQPDIRYVARQQPHVLAVQAMLQRGEIANY